MIKLFHFPTDKAQFLSKLNPLFLRQTRSSSYFVTAFHPDYRKLHHRGASILNTKRQDTWHPASSSSICCWPESIDKEMKAGIDMAEKKEVIKTLELLGMVPALIRGNVFKQEGEDILCINAPH